MEETDSFWPNDLFGSPETTTPLAIMKEQASQLSKMSKFRLKAEIVTAVTPLNKIRHTFYLVVPRLDNYRYELLEIEHGPIPYPVTVISVSHSLSLKPIASARLSSLSSALNSPEPAVLNSEGDFISWLRSTLGDPETKKIIGALFSQATA